ncbi:hypothetical protein EV06_1105 [Prochlorococcus sp. MIT 0602]|nr:hypothetical protein EV06_1105 [Prochlorococcus sp. MIT 0602]KGG17511.1 hypothetical protein EV07_0951 [Prochlorococcus sp. MIT 0603]
MSKDFEKLISSSKKGNELILAKIHDIYDDDIREEYALAFAPVKFKLDEISTNYDSLGITEESANMYDNYTSMLESFKNEYEI